MNKIEIIQEAIKITDTKLDTIIRENLPGILESQMAGMRNFCHSYSKALITNIIKIANDAKSSGTNSKEG